MSKKCNVVCLFVLLITFCMASSLSAASKEKQIENSQRVLKQKIESYDSATRGEHSVSTTQSTKPISLISRSAASVSPGVPIGNTWYDQQHHGTIGRMVDWGNDPTVGGKAFVHFSWTKLPGAALQERNYGYNHYNSDLGLIGGVSDVQPTDEYGGYVNVQSAGDARAVIGGYNDQGAGEFVQLYYDFSPGFAFWSNQAVLPDTNCGFMSCPPPIIWPKFDYHEGTDTVTHVIAKEKDSEDGDPQALYYYRKVGANHLGVWDDPPYVIDSIFNYSHDITASKTSDKVVMAWTANLNYDPSFDDGTQFPSGLCDSCSGTSPFEVAWDNDIYYQTSDDQGITWNPRVNATKAQYGEAGFRAYTDLSVLLDASDNAHVVWNAVPWAADFANTVLDNQCRLFHYSENVPFIRTVANAEWAQDNFECGPGQWNINISKMQISECNGKLYTTWVQFQDLPNGVTDDCAARSSSNLREFSGSANGELYLSISADGGTTWDAPRNLTNTRTPGCDPNGGGGDCASENWASMAEYGRQNIAGEDWSWAEIVDPSGVYAGDYFLDVQYVNDRDAGGVVVGEGTWQLSNINWFRLACIEPTPAPQITFSPNNISLPTWTIPSVELALDLTIENNGNVGLTYSTTIEEDNGTVGWLAVSGLSGAIPSGLSNVEVGTLHLNNGGVQATEAGLVGRVIFSSNAPTSPDTLSVYLAVVDTLVPSEVDTVSGYLSLAVSNNGNYGNKGDGRINLDFVTNSVDCDTTADVYLYDGSPIILTANGGDTTLASSIYSDSWLSPNGFRPTGGKSEGSELTHNWYSTGTFTTPDSTIAFEQTFYVPTVSGANYVIKKLKVWSHDGAPHIGLRIGDAIDYDIPSDSFAWNSAAYDATRNLIYQIGAEFDQDDTLDSGGINPDGTDCVDADTRFGGMAFLTSVLNGTDYSLIPYSAYTARNDSFVFPNSNFDEGQLWMNMDQTGFTVESSQTDQHMVMCYNSSLNLGATDTVEYWITLLTVQNGTSTDMEIATHDAMLFYNIVSNQTCCIGLCGNFDCSPSPPYVDIADLVGIVAYMFQGGPPPCCLEAITCLTGGGDIDISDLVAYVCHMFGWCGPFPPCP